VEWLVPVASLAYCLVAVAHLKWVLARGPASVASQYLFIVLDSVVTVVAFVGAPTTLGPLYSVLMVQIVRCGMRYGLRTMWLSWASAAVTAALLMPLSPYWMREALLLHSFVTMMIVIPVLFVPMLRRLHRVAEELRIAAGSDPLTGLSNRRMLDEHIRLARARCERQGSMLAVMLFDLDNFKGVNDGFGHAMGDRLLERVAQAIQRSCREQDFLARIGGDEFVLLVEGLPLPLGRERALAIADKVVAAVQATADELVPGAGVSASAGVHCWSATGSVDDPVEDLVEQADRAMYLAKRSGKARVAMAG
jgi:diguanylate cyclase (GGDEF)-like protein